jgi:hypothetical protein
MAVVHNLVMDVDRWAVNFQRQLDNIHGANNARAESAGPNA